MNIQSFRHTLAEHDSSAVDYGTPSSANHENNDTGGARYVSNVETELGEYVDQNIKDIDIFATDAPADSRCDSLRTGLKQLKSFSRRLQSRVD